MAHRRFLNDFPAAFTGTTLDITLAGLTAAEDDFEPPAGATVLDHRPR